MGCRGAVGQAGRGEGDRSSRMWKESGHTAVMKKRAEGSAAWTCAAVTNGVGSGGRHRWRAARGREPGLQQRAPGLENTFSSGLLYVEQQTRRVRLQTAARQAPCLPL